MVGELDGRFSSCDPFVKRRRKNSIYFKTTQRGESWNN